MATMVIVPGPIAEGLAEEAKAVPLVVATDPVRITVNDKTDPLTVTFRLDLPDNTIVVAEIAARDFVAACRDVLDKYPELFGS